MLSPSWIIQKKRDGKKLQPTEIQEFIRGITDGQVADYQATAFLMATYFQGMSLEETLALTQSMLESGEHYDLSSIPGTKVDKHSTGGVGDKVSLILAPLAAACGLKVPMMSGRGLGHSGGTLDKLEAIPGFDVNLTQERFKSILEKLGCAMTGQTSRICPADKKLYALRDVTATVECIPLICASILSKKIAEGSNALVLDVKVGNGAFMKTQTHARKLAKTLIQVAQAMGLPTRAVLSDMNQPLGYSAGNAIEVKECVEILRGQSPSDLDSNDLKDLTLLLCAHMLQLGKVVKSIQAGKKLALRKLEDGSAWKLFQDLVREQGGKIEFIEDPEKISLAPIKQTLLAEKSGYVSKMQTEELGKILIELGGGRTKASDQIDPSVGLIFHRKIGQRVRAGDPLVTVYAQPKTNWSEIRLALEKAITLSKVKPAKPKLILEEIHSA